MGLLYGENFIILASTDGLMDGGR